jgi:integrase
MPHVRLYLLLALYTAGRPIAILDLTWDRVDFKRRTIQLDNPERDRTKKGRATVPLDDNLAEQLLAAQKGALTKYVIEWNGNKVESIKGSVKRTARRAKLAGVTPYVLRHTAAVWMVEGGVPMGEISQYLGHTSTAVTERTYARYSPTHLRRAASAISDRLNW